MMSHIMSYLNVKNLVIWKSKISHKRIQKIQSKYARESDKKEEENWDTLSIQILIETKIDFQINTLISAFIFYCGMQNK